MALVPTFIDGFQYYSYVQCNILSKFDFQDARIKVKVIMAIFRKKTTKLCHHSSAYIHQWILI